MLERQIEDYTNFYKLVKDEELKSKIEAQIKAIKSVHVAIYALPGAIIWDVHKSIRGEA